ncbi:MAG: HAD family hydrolase [Clostridia bacterium]|nr:HAD family hydrolase [Clostridia bacterium]
MDRKIKLVMFDLDGTLLPMDQDIFVGTYFKLLAKKMSEYGYEPKTLIDNVWKCTYAMIKNNGQDTNENIFWKNFAEIYGNDCLKDTPLFDKFYKNEFQKVKEVVGFNTKSREIIALLKNKGYRTVLATNPVFPAVATKSRCKWAGIEPEEFELITTYENSSFSKPNPQYFLEITEKLNIKPEECLMVGNDVSEDGAALKTGMSVFFLTDCLINKNNEDISKYPHGSFNELINYINN